MNNVTDVIRMTTTIKDSLKYKTNCHITRNANGANGSIVKSINRVEAISIKHA